MNKILALTRKGGREGGKKEEKDPSESHYLKWEEGEEQKRSQPTANSSTLLTAVDPKTRSATVFIFLLL